MAAFSSRDTSELDWQLMQNGAITLYYRHAYFDADLRWLQEHGYRIHCISCDDIVEFRRQMSEALHFQESFGYSPWNGVLAALNDGFWALEFDSCTGVVFAFVHFDRLLRADREFAQGVLDIVESNSRDSLLTGCRLLALVQSDDPAITFDELGGRQPNWNQNEWLNKARGL